MFNVFCNLFNGLVPETSKFFSAFCILDFIRKLTFFINNEVEIVVQFSGKIKEKMMVPANSSKEELEKLVFENEKVKSELEGKTVRKVIVVPGKLVNIVAN